MSYLLSLIVALFKGWLGFKQDSATAQGKAEQAATDMQAALNVSQAEAQAAANAPTDKVSLIDALKTGKIAILFCLLFTSCAPNVSSSCPTMRQFTPAQEDSIAASFATLPSDSPLIAAGIDWVSIRQQVKACQQVN